MADRENNRPAFIKKRRNKIQKDLRQDPRYRQKREKTKKERERVLEEEDARQQIKEFTG